MKLYIQCLVPLVAVAVALGFSACTSVVEVERARTPMTVREARKSLTEALSRLSCTKDLRDIAFSRLSVSYKVTGTYAEGAGVVYPDRISFAGIKKLSIVGGDGVGMTDVFREGQYWKRFDTHRAAEVFVDSILTLREAALAPDTEEADFAAFAVSAKDWLTATPKPGMPDEARTFKVLAEDAFRRKDFAGALEAYCNALERYPMWPEGHYNAALLAAESGDYGLAAHHMRRYLVLAPNAKDTTAAQDMLLLWQHKAKE